MRTRPNSHGETITLGKPNVDKIFLTITKIVFEQLYIERFFPLNFVRLTKYCKISLNLPITLFGQQYSFPIFIFHAMNFYSVKEIFTKFSCHI